MQERYVPEHALYQRRHRWNVLPGGWNWLTICHLRILYNRSSVWNQPVNQGIKSFLSLLFTDFKDWFLNSLSYYAFFTGLSKSKIVLLNNIPYIFCSWLSLRQKRSIIEVGGYIINMFQGNGIILSFLYSLLCNDKTIAKLPWLAVFLLCVIQWRWKRYLLHS